MQVCTSLQTDNNDSTPPHSFLQAGCPSCCPTNSVKALKARMQSYKQQQQQQQPFNGLFSRTTWVSRYQKGKPIWILLQQETVSSSGISWAICKSAPRSRQITTPVPHHAVFYRPDALPAAQPTASKHWSHTNFSLKLIKQKCCCVLRIDNTT